MVAIGLALFGLMGPDSLASGLAFFASLLLSLLVNFSISYIVGMISFWTTSVYGMINSKRFILEFLSGALVPLAFFPDWLKGIVFALPFHSIVHLPVSIYLGKIKGQEVFGAIGQQAAWAAALWLAGALIWSRASRKVTIHGG